ncbi:hypothetical protein BC936DRAFT_149874 [Jimgerdemannia flammicorona]|uniref:Ion transport domain-containing protein n=1 Tax=Jimgerdemannia flammicorona TaxID=994334 RepID=A0A433DN21_9FUNG|nr:hypothetical protein BC936DRAFT_149874 [Jimgerdemannia flammicorona]
MSNRRNNAVVIPMEGEFEKTDEVLYRVYAADYTPDTYSNDSGKDALVIDNFLGESWGLPEDHTSERGGKVALCKEASWMWVEGYFHGVLSGTYHLVASIRTETDNRPDTDLPGGLSFLVEPRRKTDPANKSGDINHPVDEQIFKDNNGKGWVEYILPDCVYIEPCYGGVDVKFVIYNTNGDYKRNLSFDYVELRRLTKHQQKSPARIQQTLPPKTNIEENFSSDSLLDPTILSLFDPKESYRIFFAGENFDTRKDDDHCAGAGYQIMDHEESEFGKVVYIHRAHEWDVYDMEIQFTVQGLFPDQTPNGASQLTLDIKAEELNRHKGEGWFEWPMPEAFVLQPTLGWSAVTFRTRKGNDRDEYYGLDFDRCESDTTGWVSFLQHFDWVELRPRNRINENESQKSDKSSDSEQNHHKSVSTPHQSPIDRISLSESGTHLVSLSRQDGHVTVWSVHDGSLERYTNWKFAAIADLYISTPYAATSVAIRDDARSLVIYEEPIPRSDIVTESSDQHQASLSCTAYSIDPTLNNPKKIVRLPSIRNLAGFAKFVHPQVDQAEIQAHMMTESSTTLQQTNPKNILQPTSVQKSSENVRGSSFAMPQTPHTSEKFLFSTTDYLYVFDATTWKLDHWLDLRSFQTGDSISKHITTNIMINSAINLSMIRLESENIASIFSVKSGRMKMRLQSAEGYKHMGSSFYGYSKMAISASGDLAVIAGIRGKLTVFDARTGLRLGERVENVERGDISYVGFTDIEDRIVTLIRRPAGEGENSAAIIEAQIRDIYNDCQVIATTRCDAVPVFGRVLFNRGTIIAIDGFDITTSTVELTKTISEHFCCIAEHPRYTTPMQSKNGNVSIKIDVVTAELSNSELRYLKHFVCIEVQGQPSVVLYPEPWMRSSSDNENGIGDLLSAYLLEDGKRCLIVGSNTVQVWITPQENSPLALQYIWSTPLVEPNDNAVSAKNFKAKKLLKKLERQRIIHAIVLINSSGHVKLRLRCVEGEDITIRDETTAMYLQYELTLPDLGDRFSHFIVDHLFDAVDLVAAIPEGNCAVQIEAVVGFCGYYASRINNFTHAGKGVTLIGKLIQENTHLDPRLNELAIMILKKNTYLPRCHHSRLSTDSTSLALAIKNRNTQMVLKLMNYFQRFHNEPGGHTDAAYMVLIAANISDLCITYPSVVTYMLKRVSYLPSAMEQFVNENGKVLSHYGPNVTDALQPIFINEQLSVKLSYRMFANTFFHERAEERSSDLIEKLDDDGLPLRVCVVPLADLCVYPHEKSSFWDTWIKPRSPFSREALAGRDPLFDSAVMEATLAFKWQVKFYNIIFAVNTYAKYYVYFIFFLHLFFAITVSVGIGLASVQPPDTLTLYAVMCISIVIACFFLFQEFRQMTAEPKAYFYSIYNYLDLCTYTLPIVTCSYVLAQGLNEFASNLCREAFRNTQTVTHGSKATRSSSFVDANARLQGNWPSHFYNNRDQQENFLALGCDGLCCLLMTALMSTYFFVTGDYGGISMIEGKPTLDFLKVVFSFLTGKSDHNRHFPFPQQSGLNLIYSFFSVILLLNMLISLMSDVVSDTKETGHKAWLGQLASVIAEVEVRLANSSIVAVYMMTPTQRQNSHWFPTYIYYYAAADTVDEWVRAFRPQPDTATQPAVDDLKTRLEEMKKSLEGLEMMLAKTPETGGKKD